MSEGALWLIYASGALPAFVLRRWFGIWVPLCCAAGGVLSLLLVLAIALPAGIDLNQKWSIVGFWVSFCFGAIAGLIGAGAALWRE